MKRIVAAALLVWKSGSGNTSKGGITVLLNRDGTPVISEEV